MEERRGADSTPLPDNPSGASWEDCYNENGFPKLAKTVWKIGQVILRESITISLLLNRCK